MNIEEFIKEVKKLNIEVTEQNLKDLEKYKDLLIEYNKKFNLTAIKTEEEIYLKHFYDSLTLTKGISLEGDLKLLDIDMDLKEKMQGFSEGVDKSISKAIRILPSKNMEGFFVAKLRK